MGQSAWDEIFKGHQSSDLGLNTSLDKLTRWAMIAAYLKEDNKEYVDYLRGDEGVKKWEKPSLGDITLQINRYLRANYPNLNLVEEEAIKSDLFRMGAWVRAFKALKKITGADVPAACTLWVLYCFGFGESIDAINKVIKEVFPFNEFDAAAQLAKLKSKVVASEGSEEKSLYRLHPDYQEFLNAYCTESKGLTTVKVNTEASFRQEFMQLHFEGDVIAREAIEFPFALQIKQACQNYHRENTAYIRDSFNYAYCHEQEGYVQRYKQYFLLRSAAITDTDSREKFYLEIVSFVVEAFFWYDEFTDRGILIPLLDTLKQQAPKEAPFFTTLARFIESYPPKELEVRKVGGRQDQWHRAYSALHDLKLIVDKAVVRSSLDTLNKRLAQAFLTNYLAESLHFQRGKTDKSGRLITDEVVTQSSQEALAAVDALGGKFQWISSFFMVDVIQSSLHNASFQKALTYCLKAYESVETHNKNEPEIRSWIFGLLGHTYYAMQFFSEASKAWAVARYYAMRFQHDQQAQGNAAESPPPDSYTVSFLTRTLDNHITIARRHYRSCASPEEQTRAITWLTDIRNLLNDTPVAEDQLIAALRLKGGPRSALNKLLIPPHVQQSNPRLMQYAALRTASCKDSIIQLQQHLVKNLTTFIAMRG